MTIELDVKITGTDIADLKKQELEVGAELQAAATINANGITTFPPAGGGTTPPAGGGTMPPVTTPPVSTKNPRDPNTWTDAEVAAKYFPTDYGNAVYPSPENSVTSVDAAGNLHGKPYLMDAQGAVFQFDLGATGKPIPVYFSSGNQKVSTPEADGKTGYQISVNGVKGSTWAYVQMSVHQGQVYLTDFTGHIGHLSATDSPNAGITQTALPASWANIYNGAYPLVAAPGAAGGGVGGVVGGVPVPADPPAQAVAFGSSGRVVLFGPDQPLTSVTAALATALPGDIVRAAPSAHGINYAESFDIPDCVVLDMGGRWKDQTMAQVAAVFAVPGPVNREALAALWQDGAIHDGASVPVAALSHGLGGAIVLNNGQVTGIHSLHWGMNADGHDGTSAIRFKGNANGTMSGDNNFIEKCQNGIGPGGNGSCNSIGWSNTVVINCGFSDGAGGAHSVYFVGVRDSYGPGFFSDSSTLPPGDGGHSLKSRAQASTTVIAPAYIKGGDSSAIDISNGSAAICNIGGTIEQIPNALNHTLLGYGAEGASNGVAGVKLKAVLRGMCDSPNIVANGPIDATGSTSTGNKVIAQGASTVTDLP